MSRRKAARSLIDPGQSPLRSPQWRFNRVLEIENTTNAFRKLDDEWIRELRCFKRKWDTSDATRQHYLETEYPALCHAYQLYEHRVSGPHHRTPLMMEMRILAGQDDDEISREVLCPPESVQWYEKAFFHVRDRLHAHDWVLEHVLMPAIMETMPYPNQARSRETLAEPFFDATLKCFAYFGGPFVLDFMLSGYSRLGHVPGRQAVDDWLDANLHQQVRRRSSMAAGMFTVNQDNVMELMNLHGKLQEVRQNAQEGDRNRTDTEANVAEVLNEFQISVGTAGREQSKGTVLAEYDESAVESRDDEVMDAAVTGRAPATIEELRGMEFPDPPARGTTEGSDAPGNDDQGG